MEPIVLEAMIWITLLGSTPIIWWVFYVLGRSVTRLIFPGRLIELKVVENGCETTYKFAADDDSALVDVLIQVRNVRLKGATAVVHDVSVASELEPAEIVVNKAKTNTPTSYGPIIVDILSAFHNLFSSVKSGSNKKDGF